MTQDRELKEQSSGCTTTLETSLCGTYRASFRKQPFQNQQSTDF